MVRSMLKGKSLPKELWGETVSIYSYLLNKFHIKKLENVTPEEAWSGFKPNLNFLRVFGSIVSRHVPGLLRKKLDGKGDMMILVGYHSIGGYKLFGTLNRRIVINRDVVIDELEKLHHGVTGY